MGELTQWRRDNSRKARARNSCRFTRKPVRTIAIRYPRAQADIQRAARITSEWRNTLLAHFTGFGGTLVSYAYLSGRTDPPDVLDVIGRHVNWTGFWEINWLNRTEPALAHASHRDLVELEADRTQSKRRSHPATGRLERG